MGNLLTSLLNSAGALRTFERALNVTQNNVANVNTPGFAKQQQTFIALPFDPAGGPPGGVLPGPLLSARSQYLEQSVWRQQQLAGLYTQQTEDLGQVEPQFDLSSEFGIPRALNRFFESFSQLSVNPNATVGRQAVLDQARDVAQAFRQSAVSFTTAQQNVDRKTRDVVATINRLVSHIAELNAHLRANAASRADAGLDGELHAALEELAELADFNAIKQDDGTFSIFIGGQTPVVIGDHLFPIRADFSSPQTAIRDAQGGDITPYLQSGRLGALIAGKNTVLPSYVADLNQLAQSFADRVNAVLAAGLDRSGQPPALNMFTYDAGTGAAFTLALTSMTPDQIAAATSAAPGSNGNAIAVAQLADQAAVNGFTFTEYYGNLGARVGRDLNAARENRDIQRQLVTQARTLRAEASGVSLDEEAARLLQYQRSYQAASKLVSVLNDLTATLLTIMD